MTIRPPLLIAVLFYVTLDLSMPAMPGAFVFDAGDSVESVQRHGGRATADAIAAPAPARAGIAVFLPPPERPAPAAFVSRARRPPPVRPPRTTPESAPQSEDPH